jgi:hypothetical protein
MSRLTRCRGSYGHRIRALPTHYEISWTVEWRDRKGVRYPRRVSRVTTRAGAERFAKRWGVTYE